MLVTYNTLLVFRAINYLLFISIHKNIMKKSILLILID